MYNYLLESFNGIPIQILLIVVMLILCNLVPHMTDCNGELGLPVPRIMEMRRWTGGCGQYSYSQFYGFLPSNGPLAPLYTGISVLSHVSSTLRTLTQTLSIGTFPATQVIARTSTSCDRARSMAWASSIPASQSIISFFFSMLR